jgi:ferrous iron transport protein A
MGDHQRALGDKTCEGSGQIEMTTLRELPAGSTAKVITVHGETVVSKRLMEMGVIPGTEVKVVKSAPFGDPIQIRVLGYSLALRKNEAASIEITAC